MRIVLAVAVMAWAGVAGADLYRWVDQESGSVKYSSYPPPWYGDEAKQRRAPKVEVIPSGRNPAKSMPLDAQPGIGKPDDAAAGGVPRGLEALEARRKQALGALASLPPNFDIGRDGAALRKQIETLQAVSVEMDKVDPKGAERRLAEAKVIIERIAAALRPQSGGLVPPVAR